MSSRVSSSKIAGYAALIALITISTAVPRWGYLRQRAVVEAARTFLVTSVRTGTIQWVLRDGRAARGNGLIEERMLTFRRSDLVQLNLNENLSSGDFISAGQELGRISSNQNNRRFQQLRSQKEALAAEYALLEAGARPSEVQEALDRLELARAVRQGESIELERIRALVPQGVVSQAELDAAEALDRVREQEIAVAEARVKVARSSARPEALARLASEITALEAEIAELENILKGELITSPIDGILEIGGRQILLRVYDIDNIYLRISIPESDRLRVGLGSRVLFATTASPDQTYKGEVVEISEDATTLDGIQVFWASALVSNPSHYLKSGMSGVARIALEPSDDGFWKWLWYQMMGY